MQFYSADFIFDGHSFLSEGSLLVMSDDGVVEAILHNDTNDSVQHLQGLLMPGMINAHCHLELSHLKGLIPAHTGLVDFLLSVNTGRHTCSPEQIDEAIVLAEQQMIQNGIVAVGDISNTNDTIRQKQQQQLQYHTFVECVGLLDANAQQRFDYSLNLCREFEKLHSASVVLHAPYSVSDTLIRLVNEMSDNKRTTIHNQECDDENELFLSGNGNFLKLFNAILQDDTFFRASGKNSLQTYLPKLDQQEQLILVHNTVSTEEDIRLAHSLKKELYWCLCPNANRYIENKLPDIPMMMKNDCTMVLGTDSLASNHALSILAEIQTIQHYFPLISLEEMLRWATSNGANALGMHYTLGSFEKGKKPGLVQVENVVSRDRLPENLGISLKA
jgi:cytosine/adenosine deaminase-related metal-dependent hydrolase